MVAFPRTRRERERCAVLADLMRRGYHTTSGVKFGADYLAYCGDPHLYHARYAVRVLGYDERVSMLAISAGTRVSSGAKKNLVLAAVNWGESEGTGERDGEERFGEGELVRGDIAYTSGRNKLGARHLMNGRPGASPAAEAVLGPHTCVYITLAPDVFLEEAI